MALRSQRVRIGSTTLRPGEFTFLRAAVHRGLNREATRELFRREFGVGFSNATYSELLAFERNTAAIAARADSIGFGNRVNLRDIPRLQIQGPRSGYQYGVRVDIEGTRQRLTRQSLPVRFQSDRELTRGEILERAREIIDAIRPEAESAFTITGIDITDLYALEANELLPSRRLE